MKDKQIVISFSLFALAIVLIGIFRIKNLINGPFLKPPEKIEISQEEIMNFLAQKDTDNDGLSDGDEVFRYQTSIYLDDSDSDGYNDKREIDAGSDPLKSSSTPYNFNKEGVPVDETEKEEISVAEIKKWMINNGISEIEINNLSDETIKELYNDTIEQTGINPLELEEIKGTSGVLDFSDVLKNYSQPENLGESTNLSTESQLTEEEWAELEKIETSTIKQWMLEIGAEESILNQLNDQDLRELFFKALRESQTSS